MGSFEARRGRWGAYTDLAYMDVGETQAKSKALSIGRVGIPADVNVNLSFDLKLWALVDLPGHADRDPDFSSMLLRAPACSIVRPKWTTPRPINIGQCRPRQARTEGAELGRHRWRQGPGRTRCERQVDRSLYFDIGTGESKLTFQAMAGVGYQFGWGDVIVSWRYLDYEMKSGKPIEQLDFNGPQIAAAFRW